MRFLAALPITCVLLALTGCGEEAEKKRKQEMDDLKLKITDLEMQLGNMQARQQSEIDAGIRRYVEEVRRKQAEERARQQPPGRPTTPGTGAGNTANPPGRPTTGHTTPGRTTPGHGTR